MEIIWYHPNAEPDVWINGLKKRLPDANIRLWKKGDIAHADYAVLREPHHEILAGRNLKAVFSMGAGVDDILRLLKLSPEIMSKKTPIFRLEDAGMMLQMQEYATWCVLGWFRRFNNYKNQQANKLWQPIELPPRKIYSIGVLGAGVLGRGVLESLRQWGFPLRAWSRTEKSIEGVDTYHGAGQIQQFLSGLHVLIDLLPSTPQTANMIDEKFLSELTPGACFLNLARGAHVVEEDLLAALNSGRLSEACLDVFQTEPLPHTHPLWSHSNVNVTPHIAALTIPDVSMDSIAESIRKIENGICPGGLVDINRGY